MDTDEESISISALNHFLYCQRRCALVHLEQVWIENVFTAEGRVMHERVHKEGARDSGSVRIEYGLRLVCRVLGLVGQADVVEFHRSVSDPKVWTPYPVEYKRGKPKKDTSDKVQLCAQGLCLEEMYRVAVPEGSLFYGKTRRRQVVMFSHELRKKTAETVARLNAMIQARATPEPLYNKKCESCSFVDFCMPKICRKKSVKSYLKSMLG